MFKIIREIINTKGAPSAIGPYSQAIKFGNMVFVPGQIALSPDGSDLLNSDITVQTRQAIENIKAILESAGSSLQNVLKATIYIIDMKDFNSVNAVYSEYFDDILPARACIEVSKPAKGAKVEIESYCQLLVV